jgi:metal-responsive CopG/Arc/MetJ family transcriptional regulator
MTRTSLTLPDELIAELRRRVPRLAERSAVVATALREYFATHHWCRRTVI